jgi:hypothetical protein
LPEPEGAARKADDTLTITKNEKASSEMSLPCEIRNDKKSETEDPRLVKGSDGSLFFVAGHTREGRIGARHDGELSADRVIPRVQCLQRPVQALVMTNSILDRFFR